MAPAQSKLSQPEISGSRKQKASSKITDPNFVDAESNVVTKRLKVLANIAHAKQQQWQASVEDIEDQNNIFMNTTPKNPNSLLEAANGSDDDDVEVLDNNPAPPIDSEDIDECNANETETTKHIETAEAELGESNNMLQTRYTYLFPLEQLSKEWVSPIYAFFQPTPSIMTVDGRHLH